MFVSIKKEYPIPWFCVLSTALPTLKTLARKSSLAVMDISLILSVSITIYALLKYVGYDRSFLIHPTLSKQYILI